MNEKVNRNHQRATNLRADAGATVSPEVEKFLQEQAEKQKELLRQTESRKDKIIECLHSKGLTGEKIANT